MRSLISAFLCFSIHCLGAYSLDPLLATPYIQPRVDLSLKSGNQRSLGRLGLFIPLYESEQGLLFSQMFGLWDDESAQEGNVGLGYRHQLQESIMGVYGFFDRRKSALGHHYSQITLGAEWLKAHLEVRVNGYLPTTGSKLIQSALKSSTRVQYGIGKLYEKPLKGLDLELGGQPFKLSPLAVYASYYYFSASQIKAIHGARLRASLPLIDYVALATELSLDRLRHATWFGGIALRLSLGQAQIPVGYLARKMTQPLVRDIDVLTDCYRDKAMLHSKNFSGFYPNPGNLRKSTIVNRLTDNPIEIHDFLAPSAIKEKVHSIVVMAPNEIYVKLNDKYASTLIKINCHDIGGIFPALPQPKLASFIQQSYWRLHTVGEDYGLKVHARGLGGGDSEEAVRSRLKNVMQWTINRPSPFLPSPLVPRQNELSVPSILNYPSRLPQFEGGSGHRIYATQNSIIVNESENIHIKHKTTYKVASLLKYFKPRELGSRPDRNPQFVVRQSSTGEDVLNMLRKRFDQSSGLSIEVIAGMAGLGKTQLAVEYIEQNRADYDGVFWVQARQINYQVYIDELDIEIKKDKLDDLAQHIHKALMQKDYKRVLWIYDDVPDATMFNQALFDRSIKNIWRQSATKVDVLVTSRYQDNWAHIIPIKLELFSVDSAKAYIESFFRENQYPFPKPELEDIGQLNALLGGLPLALAQAIHYLKHQQNGTGIAQYIKAYQSSHDQKPWLDYSIENLDEYEKTVWTTWDITRKSLSKEADLLLQMCCFLANDSISKLLFAPLWADKIDKFVKELTDYSLVTLHNDFKVFNLHILLQKVLQLSQDKNSIAFKRVYNLLCETYQLFDDKNSKSWERAKLWLPHVSSILSRIENKYLKSNVFYHCGDIAIVMGDCFVAKDCYTRALSLAQDHYGKKHIALADILSSLGNAEVGLGQYKAAQVYLEQALDLYKDHTRERRAPLASVLHTLGNASAGLGNHEQARAYFKRALALKIGCYGKNHIALSYTLGALGSVEHWFGHYEKARSYYVQALVIQKKYYGDDHIILACGLGNLGNIEVNWGRYDMAKNYYLQALALQKKYYGEGHIKTAEILGNLGNIETHLGHYEEAKDYYHQALALERQYYGKEHVILANALGNLGNIALHLGHDREAKDYFIKALALQKSHYGEGHSDLAITLANLGKAEMNLGQVETAKGYLEQSLLLQKNRYGDDHIELTPMLENLGSLKLMLGDYQQAKSYCEQILVLETSHYGPEHIGLVSSLISLGSAEMHLGRYQVAKDHYLKALDLQKSHYGNHHVKLAVALVNLGNVEIKLDNYEQAKKYYVKALRLQTSHYGENSVERASTLIGLGSAELLLQQCELAKTYYAQALELKKAHYGEAGIELAGGLLGLGDVEFRLKHGEAAKDYYLQALALQKKYYGEGHIALAATLRSLGSVELKLNDDKAAKEYLDKALALQEKHYGENHIILAATLVNLGDVAFNLNCDEVAKNYYTRSLAIQKSHKESPLVLANTLKGLGHIALRADHGEKARNYYNQALVLQKKHYGDKNSILTVTLYNLASIAYRLKDYKQVKVHLKQILAIEDHHETKDIELAHVIENLGSVEFALAHYEKAKNYYNRALVAKKARYGEVHIEVANTLYHLGEIALRLGESQNMKIAYEEAERIKATVKAKQS